MHTSTDDLTIRRTQGIIYALTVKQLYIIINRDTKNGSISPGSASEIRNTLLSMPQNEKTQDYLSSLNDDELEQNYKLAEESLNIGLLQGRYLPPDPSYLPATAASLSFYDRGDAQAQKYFSDIAHGKSDKDEKKAISQAVKNTSSTVDTSFMTFSNTSNSSADYKAKIDDYNRKNKPKQEFKYADEKKSESSESSATESEDVIWVSDFSKEKTESGIVVEEAAYLVLDLAGYNAAKLDGLEDRDWMNLSIGYDLFYKEGEDRDKKELSAEEIAMKNTLKSWNKEEIYKFEGLDMAVYSKMIDGKKHVVVVNAGSENLFQIAQRTEEVLYDWGDNAARYVGSTDDVEKSIEYAKKIVDKYKDANITFVGYSKGGAEAAANAMATGKDAVLFNPAVPRYRHKYGIDDNYKGNMVTYIVSGEILSETDGRIFNELPGETKYIGENNSIFTQLSLLSLFLGALPQALGIMGIWDSISNHGLSSLISKGKPEEEK